MEDMIDIAGYYKINVPAQKILKRGQSILKKNLANRPESINQSFAK